jgi:segregation and condensation protein A
MSLATLDLDLEVFNGPFDLLLTLVLREEIDLLEVDLAEVVLAYVEHLERAGELDLEAATEFLVLIAALLELKSRLMLPQEEEEGLDLEPHEAAEELLARMLEYHRYRAAAEHLHERLASEHGHRYRSAPLPPELRRISVDAAEAAYDPELLARAVGDLLRVPPPIDLGHVRRAGVSVEQRLRHLRGLLASRSRFSFDEAVQGADRLTEAVTLFALLELYKAGEASWEQEVPFGPITVVPATARPAVEGAP